MRERWTQGKFCDVILKSCDGQSHRCHRNVLSAASDELTSLLGEGFSEEQQIQRGEPIEIAASADVVGALLDHIYGGEPEISSESALELWRLASAYGLPKLVAQIESELRATMDVPMALQLLKQIEALGLGHADFREACEDEIAHEFERSVKLTDFTKLSAPQMARILSRNDLWVTREEIVLEGLFTWIKASSDRKTHFGTLLQHIDFRSLSAQNLKRLAAFPQAMGQGGFELQCSVETALRLVSRTQSFYAPPAKRRCFRHWSPELGSFSKWYSRGSWVAEIRPPRDPSPTQAHNFCWHQGHFYIADGESLTQWEPGASHGHCLIPKDVNVFKVAIAASQGKIYLADHKEVRIYDIYDSAAGELGQPRTVVKVPDSGEFLCDISCSPDGVLYMVLEGIGGGLLKRWDGSEMVPVNLNLPRDFVANCIFASQGEILYISGHIQSDADSDVSSGNQDSELLILRVDPDQSQPVVVGQQRPRFTQAAQACLSQTPARST